MQVVEGERRLPQTYSITDMCRAYGVTSRALRHYEGLGLLSPRRRGLQRIYDKAQRDLIELIGRWRSWGLPLPEIRRLLDLRRLSARDSDALRSMRELLSAHVERLHDERARLAQATAAAEVEIERLNRAASDAGGRSSGAGQFHLREASKRRATA